jgi:hypothetical protein
VTLESPNVNGRHRRPGFAWWFACALLVSGLFVLGRTSYAVGLFVSPWDKLVHAAVFALLTWFLFRAFGARAALLAAGVALCVGAADELHQLFLTGRTSDVSDFLADGVGAGLAALALRRVERTDA